jgi:hypothetical protein
LPRGPPQLFVVALHHLINVLGAALGLLVLLTWLLLVLADQSKMTRSLNRLLPNAIQPDFWVFVRIVDRSFRAFGKPRPHRDSLPLCWFT